MSAGMWRILVIPDENKSFQNRFDGCAYACPVIPVFSPGFTPTRRRIRFGGIVSRRRESLAVGSAIGGLGESCGVALLRLRLFGDGGVGVMID